MAKCVDFFVFILKVVPNYVNNLDNTSVGGVCILVSFSIRQYCLDLIHNKILLITINCIFGKSVHIVNIYF